MFVFEEEDEQEEEREDVLVSSCNARTRNHAHARQVSNLKLFICKHLLVSRLAAISLATLATVRASNLQVCSPAAAVLSPSIAWLLIP